MATMAQTSRRDGQAHFHPAVYRAMAAFAALMLAASMVFFADAGRDGYLYVVVAGFVLVALALPYTLRRMRASDARPWRGGVPPTVTGASLRACSEGDFGAGEQRIRGRDAMIQAVLPIAAVGVGMMVLALALIIATAGLPA